MQIFVMPAGNVDSVRSGLLQRPSHFPWELSALKISSTMIIRNSWLGKDHKLSEAPSRPEREGAELVHDRGHKL